MTLITGSMTIPTLITTGSPVTGTRNDNSSLTIGSYSPGTFSRTRTGHWSISVGNGTILGIADTFQRIGLKFTTPVVKDNQHTLDITSTLSWQRVLTN